MLLFLLGIKNTLVTPDHNRVTPAITDGLSFEEDQEFRPAAVATAARKTKNHEENTNAPSLVDIKIVPADVSIRPDMLLTVTWNYMKAMRGSQGMTEVSVRGYEKHRCDPDYVRAHHAAVNGMISEFRKGTLNIYKELKTATTKSRAGRKLNDTLHRQAKWAAVDIPRLQVGLSKYNTFCVDMLNAEYLMTHVQGCIDEELAFFLIKMANCKSFSLASKPLRGSNQAYTCYDIVVCFDDGVTRHMFGNAANMKY